MAVGGYTDDNNNGTTWVFVQDAQGAWSQQGIKLRGNDIAGSVGYQGYTVALSADGNTLAVGGYSGGVPKTPTAWIFVRNPSDATWWQQGPKLLLSNSLGDANQQGTSVALSGDGNTLAVGSQWDNNHQGAVWIFVRNTEAGAWAQQGEKLVGTNNEGFTFQGCSVSLSADGNTLAVGGRGDTVYMGATWIFVRSGGTWGVWGQKAKLVGTGATGTQLFQGQSVSLSADAKTLAVGGSGDASSKGATWIFAYNSSSDAWAQQGPKLVGDNTLGTSINQGYSVSLTGDGNTLAVGGARDNSTRGATWIFARDGNGTWSQFSGGLLVVSARCDTAGPTPERPASECRCGCGSAVLTVATRSLSSCSSPLVRGQCAVRVPFVVSSRSSFVPRSIFGAGLGPFVHRSFTSWWLVFVLAAWPSSRYRDRSVREYLRSNISALVCSISTLGVN
jgi:hypothetical protein